MSPLQIGAACIVMAVWGFVILATDTRVARSNPRKRTHFIINGSVTVGVIVVAVLAAPAFARLMTSITTGG